MQEVTARRENEGYVVRVPLGMLGQHPECMRSFDRAVISELLGSIRSDGLAQLPLVRPKGGGYQIISGHRRVACCRALAKEGRREFAEIPVYVREDLDDFRAAVLVITTNMCSTGMSKLERGRACSRLMELVKLHRGELGASNGERTSDLAAKLLSEDTGIAVSGRTVSRWVSYSANADESFRLAHDLSWNLIRQWQGEFESREGFRADVVRKVAECEKSVQRILWKEYREEGLTPRLFNAKMLRRSVGTEEDANALLSSMIKQARELNALRLVGGANSDEENRSYLKRLMKELVLLEGGKAYPTDAQVEGILAGKTEL